MTFEGAERATLDDVGEYNWPRGIRYRLVIWWAVDVIFLVAAVMALVRADWWGALVIAIFAVVAGIVGFRTFREGYGHTVLTAIFTKRLPR